MKIKVKVPTDFNGSAQGIKVSINETEIPFVAKLLCADKCLFSKTGEGIYEIECAGIRIYEDEQFKTLHIAPIPKETEE